MCVGVCRTWFDLSWHCGQQKTEKRNKRMSGLWNGSDFFLMLHIKANMLRDAAALRWWRPADWDWHPNRQRLQVQRFSPDYFWFGCCVLQRDGSVKQAFQDRCAAFPYRQLFHRRPNRCEILTHISWPASFQQRYTLTHTRNNCRIHTVMDCRDWTH